MPVLDQRESRKRAGLRNAGLDQRAADDDAEDDGADGQAFDPAVGDDQQAVRQVFGQDAVFGRRVGRGTEADDGIGGSGWAPQNIMLQPTILMRC
jgi:hypothetical protein